MANIVLDNLVKTFGKQIAVNNLCLDIKDKEFIAILGPSGCGKTTTMNMISGLLRPNKGKVYFDGKEMNDVPPGKRGVGFVFQNYAVFGHMSVYGNISYGLKIKKLPESEIDREVEQVADLLQIGHLLKIKASSLSLNDMQKVALARSMITKPKIFLLDEPLSNLDAALRNIMRAELKNIQKELGQTTVYVTHDQVEAMILADRIAVMNFAVLQQFDTPHMVYNHPKNLFVANFIGSPTMNFFEGTYRSGEFLLEDFQNGVIAVSDKNKTQINKLLKHEEVVIGIRPEHLKIRATQDEDGGSKLKAKVASIEPLGSKTIIYLNPVTDGSLTETIVKSSMGSDFKPGIGDVFYLNFEERHLYLFDKVSTELVMRF